MTLSTETVHGTTAAIGEAGVIVFGGPGAGKTSLAFALVEHHRVRGVFARIVADDYTRLVSTGGRLVAMAPPGIQGRAEMRGDGVVPIATLAAVRLTHVVDLLPPDEAPRMPEEAERATKLEGIQLVRLALPARATLSSTLVMASLLSRNGLTP
jgi:serine kinase of HPr protein (carbohydrate metabolism regulator)